MIADYKLKKVMNKVVRKTELALELTAGLAVTEVTKQIRKNKSIVSSNLINSITFSTSKEQKAPGANTDGGQLKKAKKLSSKIGTTVVYAPRVEFGFVGTDSLGRTYNQPAKSFLVKGLKNGKKKLNRVFNKAMKAKHNV